MSNPEGNENEEERARPHRPSLAIEEHFDVANLREEEESDGFEVQINDEYEDVPDAELEKGQFDGTNSEGVNDVEAPLQQENAPTTNNKRKKKTEIPLAEKSGPQETVKTEKIEAKTTTAESKSLEKQKTEPKDEPDNSEIKFLVKTPAGKKFNMKLDWSSTVEEVKEVLSKMSDNLFEVNEIRLIFRGKPLNNETLTLKEIGVMNESKVYMIRQLHGASNQQGPSIQRSAATDRGFITITIPQGARAGNRLIIHPPGRSRMVVYVPRGMGPGDTLRVQLPGAQQPNTGAATTGQSGTGNQAPSSQAPAAGTGSLPPNTVLKAVCPQNARPGQEMRVAVTGVGTMKVCIPSTARPGQPFFFRLPPL